MGGQNALLVFLVTLGFGGVAVVASSTTHLPGNHQDYAPEQPIHYSHRLHAGELGIDCQYCHSGARRSRHAGVPSASVCMNCHRVVTSNFDAVLAEKAAAEAAGREPRRVVSDALRPLYRALGLGDDLAPDPALTPTPIAWVRVHQLPDFVWFDHRVHVARGLACEQCHGPVGSMERMRQFADLSMGWCLACHRATPKDPLRSEVGAGAEHVSTDCASCHF